MKTDASSARNYIKRVLIFFLGIMAFWGTLFGAWLGLSIGVLKGLLYGLGGGVVVALVIVFLGLMIDLTCRMRIARRYPTEKRYDINQIRDLLLLGDYRAIRQRSIDLLMKISKSRHVDTADGQNSFSVDTRSWRTFGERIRIELIQTNEGARVKIWSRPRLRTAVFDCGRNIEHVERICASLRTG